MILPIVGAPLGWLLRRAADWLVGLPWVPFEGPLRILASLPEPHATVAAVVLGCCAGVAFPYLWERDSVTVTDDHATLRAQHARFVVERRSVSAAFCDGKHLVLLGRNGEELGRLPRGVSVRELEAAFTAHRYPWVGADPYQDSYHRWVPRYA